MHAFCLYFTVCCNVLYGLCLVQIASNGQWIMRAANHFHDLLVDEKVTGQVMGRDEQGLLELDLLVE